MAHQVLKEAEGVVVNGGDRRRQRRSAHASPIGLVASQDVV